MKMQEIRALASAIGIKHSRMNKTALIQSIQLSEGNFDCFASALDSECSQLQCTWRDDCFTSAKKLASTSSTMN